MAQQWHPTAAPPSKNSRGPLVIAAVIGAVLVIAAAAATWWVTRPAKDSSTAAPSATVTVTETPGWDKATLKACEEAKASLDSTDIDNKHAPQARSWAELSDVDTLREIADRYPAGTESKTLESTYALTAAAAIGTWCIQHDLQ